MKFTAQQVFDVGLTLNAVIEANRGFPVKGAFRLARLHAKFNPEFLVVRDRRNAIVLDLSGGNLNEAGVPAVPDEKMPEFHAQWAEIAGEEIEVDVEPISIEALDPGCVPGLLTAQELITLGELVTE